MLKAQVRLIPEMMLRLHFPGHDDVLDPDAKVAVFVVTGLIGQHITGGQGNLAVLNARADTDGTFMDIEIRPHAVTRSVPVVEALFPEELAGEGVEREARRAFGEDGGVEGDDALEDQRVRFPFHVGRGAVVQGPRRVGRAVEVLGARVAEVDGLGVDDGAVARFGFVVDDGRVGAGGGDGVEGEAGEIVLGSVCRFSPYQTKYFIFGSMVSRLTPVWIQACQLPGPRPVLFPFLPALLPARQSTRSVLPRLEHDKLASPPAPSYS